MVFVGVNGEVGVVVGVSVEVGVGVGVFVAEGVGVSRILYSRRGCKPLPQL